MRLGAAAALLAAGLLAACASYFEAHRTAEDVRREQEAVRAAAAEVAALRRELEDARTAAEQAAAEAAAAATALRRWREPVGVAERVVVEKSARLLHLIREGEKVRTYSIALGAQPVGPKLARGDGRTPEGVYYVESRNARSRFFRALKLSYPSQADRARAAANGVDPGGDIMIHGQPNGAAGVVAGDWTDGCIAVSNPAMQEIWAAVPVGTPVEILP